MACRTEAFILNSKPCTVSEMCNAQLTITCTPCLVLMSDLVVYAPVGAGWKLERCDIDGFSIMKYERLGNYSLRLYSCLGGVPACIVCQLVERR